MLQMKVTLYHSSFYHSNTDPGHYPSPPAEVREFFRNLCLSTSCSLEIYIIYYINIQTLWFCLACLDCKVCIMGTPWFGFCIKVLLHMDPISLQV